MNHPSLLLWSVGNFLNVLEVQEYVLISDVHKNSSQFLVTDMAIIHKIKKQIWLQAKIEGLKKRKASFYSTSVACPADQV
jgi:predicted CoA-binding protein